VTVEYAPGQGLDFAAVSEASASASVSIYSRMFDIEALDVLQSDPTFDPRRCTRLVSRWHTPRVGEADRSCWYGPLRRDLRSDALLARYSIPAP
jgi:hypothetical protein